MLTNVVVILPKKRVNKEMKEGNKMEEIKNAGIIILIFFSKLLGLFQDSIEIEFLDNLGTFVRCFKNNTGIDRFQYCCKSWSITHDYLFVF